MKDAKSISEGDGAEGVPREGARALILILYWFHTRHPQVLVAVLGDSPMRVLRFIYSLASVPYTRKARLPESPNIYVQVFVGVLACVSCEDLASNRVDWIMKAAEDDALLGNHPFRMLSLFLDNANLCRDYHG